MVFPPMRESFEMSFRFDTPLIRETNINGMAINFNKLMKIVPNGFTQSEMNGPQCKKMETNPSTMPKNIPIKMRMCNGIFFIMQ
jgi:hypothetical protein